MGDAGPGPLFAVAFATVCSSLAHSSLCALVVAMAPASCRMVLLRTLSLAPGPESLRTRFENSDVTKDPKPM